MVEMSCDFEFHFPDSPLGTNWQLVTGNWLLLLAVFGDINNLMLEDEKIRSIFARHRHHVLVVILNPAAHHFTVSKLQAHDLLLLPQRLQISRLFISLVRRRSALLVKRGISWL